MYHVKILLDKSDLPKGKTMHRTLDRKLILALGIQNINFDTHVGYTF